MSKKVTVDQFKKLSRESPLERSLAAMLDLEGITYQRQLRFASPRRWTADFATASKRGTLILIECEGGTWSGGRHSRGKGYREDCEKYNAAALLGHVVLRFTGEHIRKHQSYVMLSIRGAIEWR